MSETKTMSSTKTTSTEQVRFLTVTAIGIALVYVFTWLINIRLPFAPQGGLIHLGNVPLFIFAILFGKKTGAIPAESAWDCLICCPAGRHGHRLPL